MLLQVLSEKLRKNLKKQEHILRKSIYMRCIFLSILYEKEQEHRRCPGADGTLNRTYLAGRVFSEAQALADLNAIVHPAVRADFAAWAERQEGDYVILESALLFDAGFDACVDRTVAVLAPEALRIERTCRRDGRTPGEVRLRIAAQTDDDTLSAKADYTLVNILESDLEPAVAELHRIFSHEAHEH